MKKIKIQFKKFAKLGRRQGAGMIEILIATGVVGLVMTAVVAGFVLSVKSTIIGKNKVLASTRAQEAMEVFRREKVLLGWAQFSDSIVGDTYCVNTLPSNSTTFQTMETGVCDEEGVIADTIFSREALVDILADRIRVEIVVDWQDGDRDESVSLVQEFRQYD